MPKDIKLKILTSKFIIVFHTYYILLKFFVFLISNINNFKIIMIITFCHLKYFDITIHIFNLLTNDSQIYIMHIFIYLKLININF